VIEKMKKIRSIIPFVFPLIVLQAITINLTSCGGCGVSIPLAPSNLIAVIISMSQVDLTWEDNSHNEEGFNIYRDSIRIASLAKNTTLYSDTDLKPGTAYKYQVTAFNSAGEAKSNEVWATTPSEPISIPVAPSNLTAKAMSMSQIDLNWEDNSTNEIGFYVYRKSSASGSYYKEETLNPNTTSYSDKGLGTDKTYWYKVSAYNSAGEAESNEAQATTLPKVQILDYQFNCEYNNYLKEWTTHIDGHARNNTNKTLSYVSISARLYDASNILQDTTFTNILDFPPGVTWHFEMITSWTDEKITRIEVWVDTIYE